MINKDGSEPVSASRSDDSPESSTFLGNERGAPLTWGATPLEPIGAVMSQQKFVEDTLEKLFTPNNFWHPNNIPHYVPKNIVEYVRSTTMARNARRKSLNRESFDCRQKNNLEGVDFDVLGMMDRAKSGHASPAELLEIQRIFGMPSIELASLTHPYGKRIQLLEPMRAAVKYAIAAHGGIVFSDPTPHYEVIGSDNLINKANMTSLLMTRETPIAREKFENEFGSFLGYNVERSSFVLRIDRASGFDQHKAAAIRSIEYENDTWGEQVMAAGEVDVLATELLANNDYKRAIPISTTTISTSPELQRDLLTTENKTKRRLQYMANAALTQTVGEHMFVVGRITD